MLTLGGTRRGRTGTAENRREVEEVANWRDGGTQQVLGGKDINTTRDGGARRFMTEGALIRRCETKRLMSYRYR